MYSSTAIESTPGVARKSVRATTRKLNALVVSYFSQHQDQLLHLLQQRVSDLSDHKGQYSGEKIRSWQDARLFLARNATTFKAQFLAALEPCLSEEIHTIKHQGDRRRRTPAPEANRSDELKLSLVGVEEMDHQLWHDEVMKRFNLRYEETLARLTLRMQVLFKREIASLKANPYRPEVLLRAVPIALKNCSFDEDSAQNVLLAIDPDHCIDLAPLYTELDQLLKQAGIATQLHRVRKSTSSGLEAGAVAAGGDDTYAYASLAADYPASVLGTMPSGNWGAGSMTGYGAPGAWSTMSHAREFLRRQGLSLGLTHAETGQVRGPMTGLDPSGAWATTTSAAASAAMPIEPYLVRYLDELRVTVLKAFSSQGLDVDLSQPNLLREMSADEEILKAPEFDRGTVDALAEIFDFVFSDPDIPSPLKVVIGRLQIPVLKAALTDRDFFLSANHPARKLVDALAGAAVAWTVEKGLEDPLYLQIEATVNRVLTEFDHDISLFREALLEFEEFLAAAEQCIEREVEPLVCAQEAEEALEDARVQVDLLLQQRIAAMPKDQDRTAFLLPFLTNQWREVLARAYPNQALQSDDWLQLLTTTDQLLWSTQHKRDSDERRELVTVLPGLVRQLNASLDALKWIGEEREIFTRHLIAAHMNAIRSSVEPAQDAELDDQDVRAANEAVSLLDQRIAAKQETEADFYDVTVQEFGRGMWFDFLNDEGQVHRCRLSWVSPKRSRFLFTNREGFDAFVRAEHEVCELLRQGRLIVLPSEPLVARAIDHIMAVPEAPAAE